MRLGQLSISLWALGFASAVFLGPAPSDAGQGRVFGQGAPFSLEDLPPGRVRAKLESLPGPARQRAVDWLQSFSFAQPDLDFLEVDSEGGVFYSDSFPPADPEEAAAGDAEAPAAEAITAAEAFTLHSNPGAPNVVYIDFDGHTLSGTAWNNYTGISTLRARPFDTDGNPASFGPLELAEIAEIWHRVAENYAPFGKCDGGLDPLSSPLKNPRDLRRGPFPSGRLEKYSTMPPRCLRFFETTGRKIPTSRYRGGFSTDC